MPDRRFRFGVVAAPRGGGEDWLSTARRVAELGYSTLLMPDVPQLLAPFPSLAMAAAVADLRVGTFVLAGPLRPPRSAAWEAHSLSVLTGGRFELGIGTGRPDVRPFTEELGLPYGSAVERLAQVAETIEHLRVLDGDGHTPVLIAAGGPRARALAAAHADIITLAADPLATRDEVARMAAEVRDLAGPRVDAIELAMNLFVVGDQLAPGTERFFPVDAATLIERDSLTMLRGTTQEMADELQRRREILGVSYISVNGAFLEQMAPVVEMLAGR
ncbi:MAG TPA: LLM class flavin-dependent oxidoreductase [Candidatus Dormibacteraeota bacterium]|jgi:alkanesulfonate monooxygenase SsuD/methylene tetrahydromethanopterin reductase-like flavin-dependent oxidoreductase (luciferase family)